MKYSTDELITLLYDDPEYEILCAIETRLRAGDIMETQLKKADELINALMVRIRAGDKLCEAAKEADHLLMQNNYDSEEGTRKVLHKAISDYEGKK